MGFFILCLSLFMVDEVDAYGWGYQKGKEGEKPQVGKYADIIANHQAFYVDGSDEKNIYLTFDNGYEQGYTEAILDVLKKHDVPATFFVTGHYVREEPELIKRMVRDSHIVGNHSASHPDFTKLSKTEIELELAQVEKAVAQLTEQKDMYYVRPPRGTFNEQTMETLDDLGYIQVFWSLAFKDWETGAQKGWKYAYDQMMGQIHPGAIVLLHAVSADNATALERIIVDLKKDGYSFKSLDELMIHQLLPKEIL